MSESPEYLEELAEWQERWEKAELLLTLLRAARRNIVKKRKYDYVLVHNGRVWTKMAGVGNQPAGFSWTTLPLEKGYRFDTVNKAKDHAEYLNKEDIEVREVEWPGHTET